MISKTTKYFRQRLSNLPKDIRLQATESYKLFQQNPKHPSLRFKKVHESEPIYSVRINIDYRAVCVIDGNEVVWFWIGHMQNMTNFYPGNIRDKKLLKKVPLEAKKNVSGAWE